MTINGWKYYNNAAIPVCAPHEDADLSAIENKSIWRIGEGKALLARWTSDFDCVYQTMWWYIILDTPFDTSQLNSKKRYEINKGRKNFETHEFDPVANESIIYTIEKQALASWPSRYRPKVVHQPNSMIHRDGIVYIGAYDRESGELCGYALLEEHNEFVEFKSLRVKPEYEKKGVNAALCDGVISHYNSRLSKSFYILDGARSILHETAFQDYLQKYFCFRRAYCRLHIVYRFPVNILIQILYPFRKIVPANLPVFSKVAGLLRMEEIQKSQQLGRE